MNNTDTQQRTTPETDVAEYYISGEGNFVRSDICRKLERERDEWRECATMLADAVDYYHPALRDAEDGFSAERAAIARFDELEARK